MDNVNIAETITTLINRFIKNSENYGFDSYISNLAKKIKVA